MAGDAVDALDVEAEDAIEDTDAAGSEAILTWLLVSILIPNGISYRMSRRRRSVSCVLNIKQRSETLRISCPTPDRPDWKITVTRLLTMGVQCPRNSLSPEDLALRGEVDQGFGHVRLEVSAFLNIYILHHQMHPQITSTQRGIQI